MVSSSMVLVLGLDGLPLLRIMSVRTYKVGLLQGFFAGSSLASCSLEALATEGLPLDAPPSGGGGGGEFREFAIFPGSPLRSQLSLIRPAAGDPSSRPKSASLLRTCRALASPSTSRRTPHSRHRVLPQSPLVKACREGLSEPPVRCRQTSHLGAYSCVTASSRAVAQATGYLGSARGLPFARTSSREPSRRSRARRSEGTMPGVLTNQPA